MNTSDLEKMLRICREFPDSNREILLDEWKKRYKHPVSNLSRAAKVLSALRQKGLINIYRNGEVRLCKIGVK